MMRSRRLHRSVNAESPNTTRWCGDRGSSDALGMALIAPAAIAMAIAVLYVGRGVESRATAQSAAEAAAQAAAQQESLDDAQAAAQRVGDAMLIDTTTSCASPSVSARVNGGSFEGGATIAVTVTCRRASDDLALIAPEESKATYTAFAVIDPFRAVAP